MILDLAFKITNQQNMKTFFKILIILLPFILIGIFAKDSIRITEKIQKEFVDSFRTANQAVIYTAYRYYEADDAFFHFRQKDTWEYLNLLVRKRPQILQGEAQIQAMVMYNKIMDHRNAVESNDLDLAEEKLKQIKLGMVHFDKLLGHKVTLSDNEVKNRLDKSKMAIVGINKKADSLYAYTLQLIAENARVDSQTQVILSKIDRPETYLTPTSELTWGINRSYLFPLFLFLCLYILIALILWACFLTRN